MDTSKMRNMVVLKNLPSNLIDEAIVILKPNKKIKSMDYAKNKECVNSKQEQYKNNPEDYIMNEAQMVICNYLSNLEEQKNMKYKNIKNIENKYKILRACTFLLAGLFVINAILNYFNI